MTEIFQYICQHASHAHYIFLALLFLAGLSLPISEDLLLVTAGALVSRCIPDQYLHLYTWMFIGCWLSGWEAYWMGRILGPKLYKIRWFHHLVTPERIGRLHYYYERFGVFTFIVGRFIPGGVRNALFITAGMGKMPFLTFIVRDFIGALISTSVVFFIGYWFGENYESVADFVMRYNRFTLILILAIVFWIFFRIWWRVKDIKEVDSHDDNS